MQTIIKNSVQDTLWVTVLQGLNYLIPLFVWPYLIVVLGAEGFGIVGFALAFVQFLMLLVDYGFNLSATKQIATASDREKIDHIASDTLAAKTLLLILAILLGAGILCLPRFAPYRLAVVVLLPMLCGSVLFMQWFYQGTGNIRRLWIINSACRLAIIPLTFVLVKQPTDALLAVAIQSMAYSVSALVSFGWALHKRWLRLCCTSWRRIKETMRQGLSLFVSTATSSIYAMLLVVILGYFAATQEVGLYSAVEKIIRVACYTLLLPVLQVCYPQISKMAVENERQAQRWVRWLGIGLTAAMLVIGCVLFFGGEEIMRLLGKDYEGSAKLFRIMAFIPVLIAISGVYGQLDLVAMGGEKHHRRFRNVYLVGAALAIGMVIVAAPQLTAVKMGYILLSVEMVVALGMGLCAFIRHRA